MLPNLLSPFVRPKPSTPKTQPKCSTPTKPRHFLNCSEPHPHPLLSLFFERIVPLVSHRVARENLRAECGGNHRKSKPLLPKALLLLNTTNDLKYQSLAPQQRSDVAIPQAPQKVFDLHEPPMPPRPVGIFPASLQPRNPLSTNHLLLVRPTSNAARS